MEEDIVFLGCGGSPSRFPNFRTATEHKKIACKNKGKRSTTQHKQQQTQT